MAPRREFGKQTLGCEVWDEEVEDRLRSLLADPSWILPVGVGKMHLGACSVASIQLALTGRLTAVVPKCMSEVIGRWMISTQDKMPDEVRNSAEWRDLLPLAAGTGRDELREMERAQILREWRKSQDIWCSYNIETCSCNTPRFSTREFWASAVGCLAKLVAT